MACLLFDARQLFEPTLSHGYLDHKEETYYEIWNKTNHSTSTKYRLFVQVSIYYLMTPYDAIGLGHHGSDNGS